MTPIDIPKILDRPIKDIKRLLLPFMRIFFDIQRSSRKDFIFKSFISYEDLI
jgi:hypothetical protein